MTKQEKNVTCPRCGSTEVEEGTTIDLAFGEEIPCKVCKNCDYVFDRGGQREGPF